MLPDTNSLKFPNPKSVYTCIYLERERERERETAYRVLWESASEARRLLCWLDWFDSIVNCEESKEWVLSECVRERERDLIYYGDKSMIALTEIVARDNLHWFFELVIGCVSFAVVRRFWCYRAERWVCFFDSEIWCCFFNVFSLCSRKSFRWAATLVGFTRTKFSPLGNSIFMGRGKSGLGLCIRYEYALG